LSLLHLLLVTACVRHDGGRRYGASAPAIWLFAQSTILRRWSRTAAALAETHIGKRMRSTGAWIAS